MNISMTGSEGHALYRAHVQQSLLNAGATWAISPEERALIEEHWTVSMRSDVCAAAILSDRAVARIVGRI